MQLLLKLRFSALRLSSSLSQVLRSQALRFSQILSQVLRSQAFQFSQVKRVGLVQSGQHDHHFIECSMFSLMI